LNVSDSANIINAQQNRLFLSKILRKIKELLGRKIGGKKEK